MKKLIFIAFALVIIFFEAIPSNLYLFFVRAPQADWDRSPDALIITEERPLAELDYNHIPVFQVWGDGYIVWVTQKGGKRMVFEGNLTDEQMAELITRFIQADFFQLYSLLREKDYALRHIRITLSEDSTSRLIDPENRRVYELVNFIKNGAGTIGKEYVPVKGTLIAFPVEDTSWRSDNQPEAIWPDNEFGYDLSAVDGRKEITGEELAFAWEVVNRKPVIMSNGKIYWIAVIVPKIM